VLTLARWAAGNQEAIIANRVAFDESATAPGSGIDE
jgi:hypothetical protein